jgi:hypothetical protein
MPRGGARPNTGGKREGAGRKPGSVWKPAVSEWRTCAAENAAALVGSDRDPLIFLVDRVFDEKLDIQTRVGCAAIATKYLHPTLSASTVAASHTITRIDAGELLSRVAERIAKQAIGEITIDADPAEPADQPVEAPE